MTGKVADQLAMWVMGVLADFSEQVSRIGWTYYLYAFLVLLILSIALFIGGRRQTKAAKLKLEVFSGILKAIHPKKGLDKNLANILDAVIPLVKADGYYFYLFERKNKNYVLKAIRQSDIAEKDLAPSYSGLVGYKKESYNPSLSMPAQQPEQPTLIMQGKVPLLILPIAGRTGLILIGPLSKGKKVSTVSMKILSYLSQQIQPALHILVEYENMKNQVDSITASSEAIRTLTKSTFDLDGSLATIMGLSIKITAAAGGCFLYKKQDQLEVAVVAGLEEATAELFRQDLELQQRLYNLVEADKLRSLNSNMQDWELIPEYFNSLGLEMLLLVKTPGRFTYGTAIYWYPKVQQLEQHRISALQMLTQRLDEAMDRQLMYKELAASYMDMLKMMVKAVDDLEPYSVGHSQLISRYSGIIAKELQMDTQQIQEIMLAGYLHDVGMLGISGEIIFKTGKYTDGEQEAMKLHAEVGASIIESTVSNSTVASYIRHHHERWDGYGYPQSLKGEEIPIGARIIAVVDTFCAKLAGRKNREPVAFDKAIADLQAAVGTQLDPYLVSKLISWFERKRANTLSKDKPLGACWEMRCCPSNISQFCAAYHNTDQNCWDLEHTNCATHGNACPTCIVFTEFMYRLQITNKG